MTDFIVLVVGLSLLSCGTELTVRNAALIAARFKLSNLVIGMTIIAFGTDMPELVLAINGAIKNLAGIESSGVIVGNAIGSCICQISLVVGLVAIFQRILIDKQHILMMTVFLAVAWLALFLFALNGVVSRFEGAILLALFIGYLVFLVRGEQDKSNLQKETTKETESENEDSIDGIKAVDANKPSETIKIEFGENQKWQAVIFPFFFLLAGLGLVVFSAEVVINKALAMVEKWNVTQSFVGAVIVALGTSLPELAISINAAIRNKPGLALGNIVGSNIFDLLVPIGMAGLISGVQFASHVLWFDMIYLLVVSAIFLWFLKFKSGLQRSEGIWLVTIYTLFVILKVSMK